MALNFLFTLTACDALYFFSPLWRSISFFFFSHFHWKYILENIYVHLFNNDLSEIIFLNKRRAKLLIELLHKNYQLHVYTCIIKFSKNYSKTLYPFCNWREYNLFAFFHFRITWYKKKKEISQRTIHLH